jgi:glycosyltransferase involved in cell wall biosynthesis
LVKLIFKVRKQVNTMKICMLLENFFPPDIRVEKEARALKKAGHQIYILSLNKNGSKIVENWKGIIILRISPPTDILRRIPRFARFTFSNENVFWKKELEKIVNKHGIEILHVHDLPLVKTTLKISKKYQIPIIADLHENYPETLKSWRQKDTKIAEKFLNIFSPIFLWKRTEKSVLHKVDEIITVVDEAKDHYIKDCKVSSNKVTVVMNTEDIDVFDNILKDESLLNDYNDKFVISYIGGFAPHRGIETAIKSIPKVLKEIPNAKLLLVGKGSPDYDKELKKLCKELNVHDSVIFTGWVNFNLVPSFIAISDVCLVPHNCSGHTNTTIPHKLFQYMIVKKPIIVTDCKPLKRIIEECHSGLVIPSGDKEKLAECLCTLFQDKKLLKKLGLNGRKCVEQKYNWQKESELLINLYNKLEENKTYKDNILL